MDQTHHSMGFHVSYRIMRVDRATGYETGRLDGVVDGGTINRNQDTDVVESASLDYVGADPQFGADLLRIWADLTYDDESAESIALGTFLPSAPKRETTGTDGDSIPISLTGRLKELADMGFATPVTLPAGSDPLDWIRQTIGEAGLDIAGSPTTDYRLGATRVYGTSDDADESRLSACNDLLTLMGWNSLRCDAMGRILLTPYTQPKDRAPAWTFREGAGARFLRAMTDEHDWDDVRNQVVVIYSTQDRQIRGLAQDDDPDSQFSTVTRGRVLTRTERISDVPDDVSDADLQRMADAKAAELLATEEAVHRTITFTSVYAPVTIGDVVTIDYPSGRVTGDFAIRTQKLSLTPGLPIEYEARSFSR